MNIAFFSESYRPYLSGVTNSMEILKTGLEALGHKVIVFSPHYPKEKKNKNIYRFPSLPSPYPGYRLALPFGVRTLRALRKNKIDIIHSHSPYQLGVLSLSCSKMLGVPYVFTMHTMLGKYMHYVPIVPEKLSGIVTTRYIKWFCKQCDVVIAPTKSVKASLVKEKIRTKIEIVPTGIDTELAKKADPSYIRKKYGIPQNAKILLFVGRLAKEKNIEFLLRAFKQIVKSSGDTYLMIVAGGPMEEKLKAKAPEKVIFTGQKGFPEVLDYYSAADIFVFSSLTETQGLVLVEAMSCGLPQVALDAEGVRDVVKRGVTGFLVRGSTKDFSRQVLRLLNNDKLRKKMSVASKNTAERSYSKLAFAKKIEQIYRSVL